MKINIREMKPATPAQAIKTSVLLPALSTIKSIMNITVISTNIKISAGKLFIFNIKINYFPNNGNSGS